jgi:hypothetical protein
MPSTRIELFDVPPSADEAFLAHWEREGDGTLYRSVRGDAPVRYVAVGSGAGDYEVVHDDGDVFAPGGVTLIFGTDVAPGDEEAFLRKWQHAREAVAGARGYLGTRLHRAVGPGEVRFITIARWSSPLMVARARRSVPSAVPADAALYQPLR